MQRAVVVGGGIGGLVAACQMALDGFDVQLFEAAAHAGGKMARRTVAGQSVDIGPSVLTLPEIFEDLFARAGESLSQYVDLAPMPELARHVWPAEHGQPATTLDLFADLEQSADAIGHAFGRQASMGYRAYADYTERLWHTAKDVFVFGKKPSMARALWTFGSRALCAARDMDGRRTMHDALVSFFPKTPELRQLFGRYATYAGSSPFSAPATLHLIAHVERMGSFQVRGGLSALAQAVAALAERLGVRMHFGTSVQRVRVSGNTAQGIELSDGEAFLADVVVLNTDAALSPDGELWGPQAAALPGVRPRGLSARTASLVGQVSGLPLCAHTILFAGRDERAEYRAVFDEQRSPPAPNVYLCAPDRGPLGAAGRAPGADERLFCLTNAPPEAGGETRGEDPHAWTEPLLTHLGRLGLSVRPTATPFVQDPQTFERRFPRSHGILYGPPASGWRDFFRRPGSQTPVKRCLRTGGGVHPGPGVPMAAQSGLFAAAAALADFPSTCHWPMAATHGGTSMRRPRGPMLN